MNFHSHIYKHGNDHIERIEVSDLTGKRKDKQAQLQHLGRKIEDMDRDITAYLRDQQNRSCPEYWRLISDIQSYGSLGTARNTETAFQLRELQSKANTYSRIWESMFKNHGLNYYPRGPFSI